MGFAPTFYFGKNWVVDNDLIVEKVRNLVGNAADELGVELVHVEVTGSGQQPTLRIIIDKPDGITHDDCSAVSGALDSEFESDDLIKSAFVLEVTSPGIERGLYSLGDFDRFKGEVAKVRSIAAVNGQRNFTGVIEGVEDGQVVIVDKTNGIVRIPFSDIKKAKLEVDLTGDLLQTKRKR